MLSRRTFLTRLATVTAAFTVLPSAATYARTWKPTQSGIIIPEDDLIPAGLQRQIIMGEFLEAYRTHLIPFKNFTEQYK